MFDYLTETRTTIYEDDLSLDTIKQRNLSIFKHIVEGTSNVMDLTSMSSLTIDTILEFIHVRLFSKN
jgi:hypothetical protein